MVMFQHTSGVFFFLCGMVSITQNDIDRGRFHVAGACCRILMVTFLQALSVCVFFRLWDGIHNTENDVDRGRVVIAGTCCRNLDVGVPAGVKCFFFFLFFPVGWYP